MALSHAPCHHGTRRLQSIIAFASFYAIQRARLTVGCADALQFRRDLLSGIGGQWYEIGVLGIIGRGLPGASAKHDQIDQRIRAQTVRAVDAHAGAFARREQPRHNCVAMHRGSLRRDCWSGCRPSRSAPSGGLASVRLPGSTPCRSAPDQPFRPASISMKCASMRRVSPASAR